MRNLSSRALVAFGSAAALAMVFPSTAATQAPARQDCTVRPDPSGLIRGDQIPSGCLLRNASQDTVALPSTDWETALGFCEAFTERIDFAPTPKYSTLEIMLERCKPLLEAADPANREGGADFESFTSEFGSIQRHFGSLQRHFGSIQRHFGSTQRHFGRIQRHFGREPGGDGRGGG
ncbi:MAG: hypothetical protein GWN99_08060 [Gemmatimonadetes bacterium]|uniref:Uncharacterized protein n=1 Tax=Candidatus Kutchimonas denitrificans TaxID=3056748 RepID=A0AAE4ZBR0_9BACT|nr:hypothetical protein [Gemmatimonadota bacterium]NIR75371.1 hypothetical protein [Candidatus Kutchimonas denitrificans]NIS01013.1 hypothetical protein [Gemmatimonadota bacterium]NIT66637.1 hypothetical protein [Gemmatimonadota bacterium]NIU53217.1 hypothetical protein [Gemmatimonadota bacterium]